VLRLATARPTIERPFARFSCKTETRTELPPRNMISKRRDESVLLRWKKNDFEKYTRIVQVFEK
jgi:hypothetical protein